jgi:hypothetical protein
MCRTLQQARIAARIETMQFNQVAALLQRLNNGLHITGF